MPDRQPVAGADDVARARIATLTAERDELLRTLRLVNMHLENGLSFVALEVLRDRTGLDASDADALFDELAEGPAEDLVAAGLPGNMHLAA